MSFAVFFLYYVLLSRKDAEWKGKKSWAIQKSSLKMVFFHIYGDLENIESKSFRNESAVLLCIFHFQSLKRVSQNGRHQGICGKGEAREKMGLLKSCLFIYTSWHTTLFCLYYISNLITLYLESKSLVRNTM